MVTDKAKQSRNWGQCRSICAHQITTKTLCTYVQL